jgi:hypothetical protein
MEELSAVFLSEERAYFVEIVLAFADRMASHEEQGVFVPPTQQNPLPLDGLIKPPACDARPYWEQFRAIGHFKPIENNNQRSVRSASLL